MRKIIPIALAIFLTLNSSLNANESIEKSSLLNTPKVNVLLVENRAFAKEVLDDVSKSNSSKIDKDLVEPFGMIINYFQALEDSKSPSYQAITNLENAIIGFENYPNIVTKLLEHRTEAINHFLQKVSPNLVNNQEFISMLLDGQKEAEASKLGTRRFFKYLNDGYVDTARGYMAKGLIRKTPLFANKLFENRDIFGKISIMVAEKIETKIATRKADEATRKAAEATKLLAKEKQETAESKKMLEIAKNDRVTKSTNTPWRNTQRRIFSTL